MFLLFVQHKLHNITGDEIVNLVDELYKFSDITFKSVRDTLHERLHNLVLGYNHGMPKRAWTGKDHIQTDEILQMIDNLLLEKDEKFGMFCWWKNG
nr:hypothetical protein [Tanacetum cinerariifolium]